MARSLMITLLKCVFVILESISLFSSAPHHATGFYSLGSGHTHVYRHLQTEAIIGNQVCRSVAGMYLL